MADLSFTQSSDPIVVVDDASGNKLIPNLDGSISVSDLISILVEQKKVYQISLDFNLTSTGEKMVMLLRNPSGSGKILKLISLTTGLTNTISAMTIIRMYANPTITTNGTTATISPNYIGGSQPTSAMLATTAPTISANGVQYYSSQINSGTSGGQSYVISFDHEVIVAEDSSILITGNPDGTNRNMLLTLRWSEV